MKVEKLKTSNGIYLSCQFLEQIEGLSGFSNVENVKSLFKEDLNPVIINNNSIIKSDNTEYYKLEEFNNSVNTKIIIEKDIFDNEKIWIKDIPENLYVFNNLKYSNTLSVSLYKDIMETSLAEFYKQNKLNISILNGLSNASRKIAYKEMNPEEMLKSFINMASREDIDFHIEAGKCLPIINKNKMDIIKDKIKHIVIQKIKIKSLLSEKSSSLNELIEDSKITKSKNKMKI